MPGLADGLIDDAAVFPPGNASIPDALRQHENWLGSRCEALVGPLLVPASAVDALRAVADPDQHVRLGVVGDTGLDGLVAARDALQDDSWFDVVQLELTVRDRDHPAVATKAVLTNLPFTAPTYLEIPVGVDPLPVLEEIAADGAERAKFRCGNEIVPSLEQLGEFLLGCAQLRVPFKLTAGLHHAVPTPDPTTGFTHHGFLNTLAATWVAIHSRELSDVTDVLAQTEADRLVDVLAHADIAALRSLYRSFGSCSITEPFDELAALSLQPVGPGDDT